MTEQSTMPSAEEFAQMSAPVDGHRKLEPFVGTFHAEVKMWMGPGEPQSSTGTMQNTMDLGGRFLNQVYRGDQTEGPFPNFEGRGYWGFNKTSSKFEGFWIDTACTVMQNETGDVDASGKVWTMTGEMTCPSTGQPMTKKSVITLEDDDHHTMEMYFPGPDGGEFKTMEIKYSRK